MEIEPGVILVDKPKGISSFGAIYRLRKELGVKKMGHAGTLDPEASGLMIVAMGPATKCLSHYLGLPKEYEAEAVLGVATDSGDAAGTVIAESPVTGVSEEKASEIVASLVGTLRIPVSAFSARKIGGKRSYDLARAGKPMPLMMSDMEVLSARFESLRQEGDKMVLCFSAKVGSGAYIRSLAEEIGRRLGVPASLRALRRTSIGGWKVADARKV